MRALFAQGSMTWYAETANYLLLRRNTANVISSQGAGWGFSTIHYTEKSPSKVMPTAFALSALALSEDFNTNEGVIAAIEWLISKQQANGQFGDTVPGNDAETVFATLTLAQLQQHAELSSNAASAYQRAQNYIQEQLNANGHISHSPLLTAIALRALYSETPALLDSDQDGLPDIVENKLGLNPQLADSQKLVKGNGLNGDVPTLPIQHISVIQDHEVKHHLNHQHGEIQLISGVLPVGLKIAGDTIIGTTQTTGQYLISFQVIHQGKVIKVGSASIYVMDPNSDIDNDGLTASIEHLHGLDPFNQKDADLDHDGDGISTLNEILNGTNPRGEGTLDSDNDLLVDAEEEKLGTDPSNPDTDRDLVNDGEEVALGRNPRVNEPAVLIINSSLILPVM
ncbi:hypothetical protein B9G39_26380 [Zooshikella ganghwensis]|nr:hypothetical protein B9G39_26380 [Zooshikella ganghwensis]